MYLQRSTPKDQSSDQADSSRLTAPVLMNAATMEACLFKLAAIRIELDVACKEADEAFGMCSGGRSSIAAPAPGAACADATDSPLEQNTGACAEYAMLYPSVPDKPRPPSDTPVNPGSSAISPPDRPGRGAPARHMTGPPHRTHGRGRPANPAPVTPRNARGAAAAVRFSSLIPADSSWNTSTSRHRHERKTARTRARPDADTPVTAAHHTKAAARILHEDPAGLTGDQTGSRHPGGPSREDASGGIGEERQQDGPGAPDGLAEAQAFCHSRQPHPRLLTVSTSDPTPGYRPSQATAEGLASSYSKLQYQAMRTGYRAVPLIGPPIYSMAGQPRTTFPTS